MGVVVTSTLLPVESLVEIMAVQLLRKCAVLYRDWLYFTQLVSSTDPPQVLILFSLFFCLFLKRAGIVWMSAFLFLFLTQGYATPLYSLMGLYLSSTLKNINHCSNQMDIY